MNLFLLGFTKTKTGAKTAPRAPKLSYFDGRAPQLSVRNHGTPPGRRRGRSYTGGNNHFYSVIIANGRGHNVEKREGNFKERSLNWHDVKIDGMCTLCKLFSSSVLIFCFDIFGKPILQVLQK